LESDGCLRSHFLPSCLFGLGSSTFSLQDSILSSRPCPMNSFFDSYQAAWSSSFSFPPVGSASHKQSAWDRLGLLADKLLIQCKLVDARQKAAFWQLLPLMLETGSQYCQLPLAVCVLMTRQFG